MCVCVCVCVYVYLCVNDSISVCSSELRKDEITDICSMKSKQESLLKQMLVPECKQLQVCSEMF